MGEGRRERGKKKIVDRRSVGASVRLSERMNTHSLGMCVSAIFIKGVDRLFLHFLVKNFK